MPPRKSPSADPDFKCPYCTKSFKREKTLFAHMCPKKQRHIDREERFVKIGFLTFQKFYALHYKSAKPRSYDDFANSQFYTAFTKFGKYLLAINAVNPNGFVEFLLKSGLEIDRWQAPPVYELYLRELTKKETADAALERNFQVMERWATEYGEPWTEFFRKVAPSEAVLMIQAGRISPWVLYTANSASELFARMSSEQMTLIQSALDPQFWERKLSDHADEVDAIRTVLEEVGL
jgi:hypothetical protein